MRNWNPRVHKPGTSSLCRLQQTGYPTQSWHLAPLSPKQTTDNRLIEIYTKGGDAGTYLPQQAHPGPRLRPRRRRAHRRGPEGDDDFALSFCLLSQAPLSSRAPARTKPPPRMGVASLCRVSRTEGFRWRRKSRKTELMISGGTRIISRCSWAKIDASDAMSKQILKTVDRDKVLVCCGISPLQNGAVREMQ